jgi:hypothetical protein
MLPLVVEPTCIKQIAAIESTVTGAAEQSYGVLSPFRSTHMNVYECGTIVRRLAPPLVPGYPPLALGEQGQLDDIEGEQAAVRWYVSNDIPGPQLSAPEWLPLTDLLSLEYEINFSRSGSSPVRGVIVRHLNGSTDGSDIQNFAGSAAQEVVNRFHQALTLVKENRPGQLEEALHLLREVCDFVEERPFHSPVLPAG